MSFFKLLYVFKLTYVYISVPYVVCVCAYKITNFNNDSENICTTLKSMGRYFFKSIFVKKGTFLNLTIVLFHLWKVRTKCANIAQICNIFDNLLLEQHALAEVKLLKLFIYYVFKVNNNNFSKNAKTFFSGNSHFLCKISFIFNCEKLE